MGRHASRDAALCDARPFSERMRDAETVNAEHAKLGEPKPIPKGFAFDINAFVAEQNRRLTRDKLPLISFTRTQHLQGRYTLCEVADATGKSRGWGLARAADDDRRDHWSSAYGHMVAARRAVRNFRLNAKSEYRPTIVEH